jgi:biopolymer transport protein ExbB
MNLDLIGTFKDGGWAMYPLLLIAVLGLTFGIERIIVLFLQKRKLKPDQFLDAFDASLKKHGGDRDAVVEDMLTLCKRGGVCADIMQEGLAKFRQAKDLSMGVFDMKRWITEAIEERARIELPQLESHLPVVSVGATIAPLMGLLGTVTGMIRSFTVMASAAGGAKPDELAGGISEALITTATGLIVAIPLLVIYNAVKGSVENYVLLVEEASIHLVDSLIAGKDTAKQQENG